MHGHREDVTEEERKEAQLVRKPSIGRMDAHSCILQGLSDVTHCGTVTHNVFINQASFLQASVWFKTSREMSTKENDSLAGLLLRHVYWNVTTCSDLDDSLHSLKDI